MGAIFSRRFASWRSLTVAVLALSVLAAPLSAQAADALKGVALVIGNGEYEHLSKLPNPENDARAVEDLLDTLGFDTASASDRDAPRLKRDLERFVEDASGADVAVLYYSGHGVEAGGQNYLVPVDASIGSLEDAGESLVALDAMIEKLKAQVPVVIVMLDACRDNPFPADAVLKLSPDSQAVTVAAAGLGAARSAAAMPTASSQNANVATVLAFAAEPGKVALDGEAGQNSPYAAALLRHLSAMTGEEFGMVMRMVTEEVYLKTNGRQRPWVNESMRRQLYFGKAETPSNDNGVLNERRTLLVRIAALPDPQRARAEILAQNSGVPMGVVYALMGAAGIDPSANPADYEEKLRAEIDRFASARAERNALMSPDEEIVRLTRLADDAELEGAFKAANALRDEAKARVATLRPARQEQAAALRQRILEDAEVYKRSYNTKMLLFDYRTAAADLGEAFAIARDWDIAKAFEYRRLQIDAMKLAGSRLGDRGVIMQGESLADLERAEPAWSDQQRGTFTKLSGQLLTLRGRADNDPALARLGADRFREALQLFGDSKPRESAVIWNDIGVASLSVAQVTDEEQDFRNAAEALRNSFDMLDPGGRFEEGLRNITRTSANKDKDPEAYQQAIQAVTDLIADRNPRQLVADWGDAKHNLGIALRGLARLSNQPKLLDEALAAYDQALRARRSIEDKVGMATTHMNIGNIHRQRADDGQPDEFDKAVASYQAALENGDPAANQVSYIDASLALTNLLLDSRQKDIPDAARRALDVLDRPDLQLTVSEWTRSSLATMAMNTGRAHYTLRAADDADHYSLAIAAYERAQTLFRPDDAYRRVNLENLGLAHFQRGLAYNAIDDWRAASAAYLAAAGNDAAAKHYATDLFEAGRSQQAIAFTTKSPDDFAKAAQTYQSVLNIWKDDSASGNWKFAQKNLGAVMRAVANQRESAEDYAQSAQAYAKAQAAFALANDKPNQRESVIEGARSEQDRASLLQDQEGFKRAIAGYRTAIELSDADSSESGLMNMLMDMGIAWRALANLGEEPTANLEKAVAVMEKSVALSRKLGAKPETASALTNYEGVETLASTHVQLAEATDRSDNFKASAKLYAEVLDQTDRKTDPLNWASRANSAAYTLARGHRGDADPQAFVPAIRLARDALTIFSENARPDYAAYVQGTLCDALIEYGRASAKREALDEALALCEQSVATLRAASEPDPGAISVAEADLVRARQIRDTLPR